MNLKDLKYLVALAEYTHFGRAAKACFVSQPALSMQIKKLEEGLGLQLLERTNKSVLLTDHGIAIAERARSILSQVADMREIAKSARDPYTGEITLGIFPTLAPYLLPLIIPALAKKYPKLSFYLIEEQTSSLIEKLTQGKLHAAIFSLPILEKKLAHEVLFEEEFLLAVPTTHSLAKLKMVKQQNLHNENILLLEEGHCMRDQALALCQRMKAKEAKNFRGTSLETLRHMVAAGVGLTLMPKLACNVHETFSYIPFTHPKPLRTIGLFWRITSAKQQVLKEIAQKIRIILAKKKVVNVKNVN